MIEMDFFGACVTTSIHDAILADREGTSYMSPHKSRNISILQTSLLLMSGDISTNPGPVKHRCAVCSKAVASNHRAIICDDCGK